MISETSRRVRATTCSRICAGRLGQVGLDVLGVVGVGLELDLDAGGPGRGVGRAGQPVGERLDQLGGRGQRRGRDPDGPGDRPEGVEQGLGPDPADHAGRQVDQDRQPDRQQQRRPRSRSRARHRPGRQAPTRAARVRPPTTASDSAARSVASSSWAIASARSGRPLRLADLLQPAPRVGPQGPAERDQQRLERQQGRSPRPSVPPRFSAANAAPSRPSVVGLGRADQGERVDQPLGGEDLPLARRISAGVLGVLVVEAAEVEQAVDHVQGQLGRRVDPGLARRSRRPSRPRRPARRPGPGRRARRGRS